MATLSRRAATTTRAKAGTPSGGRLTSKASGRATLTAGEVMRAVRKVRTAMELFDAQAPEVDQILKVVEQVAGRADRLESNAAVTLFSRSSGLPRGVSIG